MATYTLAYTGAEVDSAIGNAKNLFSKMNSWTGTQTFSSINASHATITSATFTTLGAQTLSITSGADISSLDVASIDGVDATFSGTFVSTGSASFTGTCDIADLSVTTDISCDTFSSTGDCSVGLDLTVGNDLHVAEDVTVTRDIEAGRNVRGDNIQVAKKLQIEDNGDPSMCAWMKFTAFGIASAPGDGVYINTSGVTAMATGDPIPAGSLYIVIEY